MDLTTHSHHDADGHTTIQLRTVKFKLQTILHVKEQSSKVCLGKKKKEVESRIAILRLLLLPFRLRAMWDEE